MPTRPVNNALKELRGRTKGVNRSEPRPAAGAPPCPAWLHRYAKAEWRRVVKLLLPLGILTQADGGVLAGYCTALSMVRLASEQLEKEGRTVTTPAGGIKAHPMVGV